MNKKFLAVIGSATVAAAFWACGSGEIYEPTETDLIFQEVMEKPGAVKNYCSDGKGCDGAFVVESSSSAAEEDGPTGDNQFGNNDEEDPIIIVPSTGGDSLVIEGPGSSSGTQVTGLGSCAPVNATVDKNVADAAQFKFTSNVTTSGYKTLDFAKASYDWNYGANGTANGAGTSTSAKVTYSASGSVVASVTVTMLDGASETIQCEPLQVNGDPITGCTCTSDANGAVDFTATPDVTWSVSGCKSTSAVNSYSWEGVAGAATSYTKTFTSAQAGWAPKLKVGNSDNTVIDVTCPAVKVTDGPEYTIKDNTDTGKVSLPGPGTYNVVIGYACQNKTFFCNGVGGPVGGSVNGVEMTSSWYTTANLTAADCSGKATVVVKVDNAATCGAQ